MTRLISDGHVILADPKPGQGRRVVYESRSLGSPASAKAREYLEQIWKPRHNNTTEGMDAFLAKSDLKI